MDSFEKDNQKQPKNEGEEPYSFIEEHIRKRPVDRRKFLWGVLRLLLSAIVFGAVAGFVFLLVTGGEGLSRMRADAALLTEAPERHETLKPASDPGKTDADKDSDAASQTSKPDPVPEDSGKAPAVTSAANKNEPSKSSAGAETSGKKASRVTPIPTPSPTPTPSVEELEAEALRTHEHFRAALGRVFEVTRSHLAFVTSTGGQEEGIFGLAGETAKTIGLIIGKDSRRLFILLDHLPEGKKHRAAFADAASASAKVFATDPLTGLTVMAVALRDLEAATLETCTPAELGNSYNLRMGDLVLAIGTTLGENGDYMHGTILCTDYPYNVPDREYQLLATEIPCAENAAGFLVDTQGRVVGVFADRFSPEGTRLLTALPISMVKTLLTNMMNREKLVSLGVMGRDISSEEAESLGVPAGIYVLYAKEESAALEAGIRTGDVIIGINGKEITSLLLLEEELYRHEPGDSLTVTLKRLGPDGYEDVTSEAILDSLETKSAA